jgi:hypothetical protein
MREKKRGNIMNPIKEKMILEKNALKNLIEKCKVINYGYY